MSRYVRRPETGWTLLPEGDVARRRAGISTTAAVAVRKMCSLLPRTERRHLAAMAGGKETHGWPRSTVVSMPTTGTRPVAKKPVLNHFSRFVEFLAEGLFHRSLAQRPRCFTQVRFPLGWSQWNHNWLATCPPHNSCTLRRACPGGSNDCRRCCSVRVAASPGTSPAESRRK